MYATLALLSDGYRFVSRRAERLGSDVFRTRLMLRPAVCMVGEEAARVFYHPGRFTRRGAMPPTTVRLLQDFGSVQPLDGDAHRHRKAMWMSLMTPTGLHTVAERAAERWRARIPRWEGRRRVVLFDEVREILAGAACDWAGIPVTIAEVRERARELGAMVEGAGSAGPRAWRGLFLRRRTERWAQDVIDRVRAGALTPPEGSPAHVIAFHREPDGVRLGREAAGVELINVLRPTVAIARFIVFAALAIHQHPQVREPLAARDEEYLEWFVQEVRRFYPFFPFIAGRVREPFEWRGHRFGRDEWVLLDLYGTDHDARCWDDPETFRPERFRTWDGGAFDLVPQGGGDHATTHRCPGEWATIEVTKTAVRLLTREMRYMVPPQDLGVSLRRFPARPRSGFVIAGVELVRG